MDRKKEVHRLLKETAAEMLKFIKVAESSYEDGWVPAVHIKDSLDLNFVAVPTKNKQYGKKGWLFATLARMLEDQGLLQYKKKGSRAFYRSKNK